MRVSREGHRDISLFFDAETALLLKSETIVRDLEGGSDKEVTQETFYSNFIDDNGVQRSRKHTTKRDGMNFLEIEISESKPADRLDASTFAKP